MSVLKKLFSKKSNITKYKVGTRVPKNKEAEKIVKKAISDIEGSRRKWL